MKKYLLIGLGIILILLGLRIYKTYKGFAPILSNSPTKPIDNTPQNTTGLPLTIVPGYKISLFATNLGNPRDLQWDPQGVLLASIPDQGRVVALPDENKDGQADKPVTVVFGLHKPHGLAFAKNTLYIGETDKVVKYEYDGKLFKANKPQKILDLPGGGNHWTRQLLIKDNQLFIAIGSSCNVCKETDTRRATVQVANLDGTNLHTFASGLRNSPFLIENPYTKDIWATEMGRDNLGDDTPPDEINILKADKNYGWPICYGQNIHDQNFDKNTYIQNPCSQTLQATVDLPAHSAPLGLAFASKDTLLVAFHGSWNRSVPTGYKIVSIDIKTKQISDFVTGWLVSPKNAIGRPVDLLFDSQKNLYVSDDKSGNIYKITPLSPQ